jgi:hypothetical protein
MPRRRRPAGLECLVELARKAAILEREMSVQRDAIERLRETAARPMEKRLLPPSRLRADVQP